MVTANTKVAEKIYDSRLTSSLFQSRKDRWIVVGLISLLFLGLLLYLSLTLINASSTQVRLAAIRNENTARLCKRLLERRCENAISELQTLASREKLDSSLRRSDTVSTIQSLEDAVELLPDLLAAAAYTTEGKRIGQYPSSISIQEDIQHTPWFSKLSAVHSPQSPLVIGVVHLDGLADQEGIAISTPIQAKPGKPAGYVLAYFRLGNFYDWLQSIRFYGGKVLILDNSGRILATSSETSVEGTAFSKQLREQRIRPGYLPFDEARQGKQGAALYKLPPLEGEASPPQQGEQMIGYAYASLPGWIILVVQPTDAAFAPYQYIIRRFAVVGIPLILAIPLVGWNLLLLYERLQRLAFALGGHNQLLYQLNQAKSDLLANVSHDLKTPIASMQISVSGLLEEEASSLALTPPVSECLTLVSQELDTLAGRVRNLLDMSRLESEKTPVLREPCDLIDIVASALERVRPLSKGRPIETLFPPTPLLIMCDPSQMETVILNILENALKYTPPGSPLQIQGMQQEDRIVLQIADRGEGLPAHAEEHVFEKFYRAGTSTTPGGTGLGLAICQAIVEAHGGTIEGKNRPDGGALFTLRLPLCELSSEEGY